MTTNWWLFITKSTIAQQTKEFQFIFFLNLMEKASRKYPKVNHMPIITISGEFTFKLNSARTFKLRNFLCISCKSWPKHKWGWSFSKAKNSLSTPNRCLSITKALLLMSDQYFGRWGTMALRKKVSIDWPKKGLSSKSSVWVWTALLFLWEELADM